MTALPLNKIMYIEDDPDIQTIAQMALEEIGGYKVKICSSGQEGLNELENFNPDLILLDVMIPGMDGPTTLTKIRQLDKFSKTPVIFLTAKAQASEIKSYIQLGAIDALVKPFDPVSLPTQVLEKWEAYQQSNG